MDKDKINQGIGELMTREKKNRRKRFKQWSIYSNMKKKNFLMVWMIIQLMFLFLPASYALYSAPYELEYYKGYITEVQTRVLDGGSGDLNVEGAYEDYADVQGEFYRKKFYIEHPSYYYINQVLAAFLVGFLLQIFNLLWWLAYSICDIEGKFETELNDKYQGHYY